MKFWEVIGSLFILYCLVSGVFLPISIGYNLDQQELYKDSLHYVPEKASKLYGTNYQSILKNASEVSSEVSKANPDCKEVTLVNMNYYRSSKEALLMEVLCMNEGSTPTRWTHIFKQSSNTGLWVLDFTKDWRHVEYDVVNFGG